MCPQYTRMLRTSVTQWLHGARGIDSGEFCLDISHKRVGGITMSLTPTPLNRSLIYIIITLYFVPVISAESVTDTFRVHLLRTCLKNVLDESCQFPLQEWIRSFAPARGTAMLAALPPKNTKKPNLNLKNPHIFTLIQYTIILCI